MVYKLFNILFFIVYKLDRQISMGTQSSSPFTNHCLENNSIQPQIKLQTAQSILFKPNESSSTFDKQQQSPGLEIAIVNKKNICCRDRVSIFSEIVQKDTKASAQKKNTAQPLQKDSMPIERIVFNHDQELEDAKRDAQRLKCSMQFQQLLLLQKSSSTLHHQKQYQLILTLDEKWLYQMKKREKQHVDIVDIKKAYKQIPSSQNNSLVQMTRYSRIGYNGRKIQMLYKQQVPRGGKYYFEIELFSYIPKNKCEFTIGFVDYFKAEKNVHSRDCCIEQSYTLKERMNRSLFKEDDGKPVTLNKTLRAEISREDGNASMSVYVNSELVYREQVRKEMVEQGITVVPYIQTQFQGVQFGWKTRMEDQD